ncbi:cyclopentanone 1,2-monooxygenase [Lentinula aff. lateritia]|uniref:Cyclopentanone 1,2-monooxygenase n=1 Tax=Lentinula aff. lateritia TaxID=2804960 RepID=A0ACC1TPL7_9AGAR|nr:cyclopentanone 1,2-monooxygenase [Lentinula aff. lateritia]
MSTHIAHSLSSINRLDALVLYRPRSLGLSVKIFKASSSIGGTWCMNQYPGVRTDSEAEIYQYKLEELWKDWTWKEKYPSVDVIQAYFRYVDEKLDLKRDIYFDTRVVSAKWDKPSRLCSRLWIVSTANGISTQVQYFILCTGSLSKPLIPDIKTLSDFEGSCFHTSRWPREGLDLTGKRVAVIGTESSGIQVIEHIASQVRHLTVFRRTPNLALPLSQSHFPDEDQAEMKETGLYNRIFRRLSETFGRFLFPQRKHGGYTVNSEAYAFWRTKVTERVQDPALHEKLAPSIPPHPFGIKRPGLEKAYFEVFDRGNVSLVDVKETPIKRVTTDGLELHSGTTHIFDVLVLATGFESLTGAILDLDIRGSNDISIREKKYSRIATKRDVEEVWRNLVLEIASKRLWDRAESSWYTGSNMAASTRRTEMLALSGGLPSHLEKCAEAVANGYQ